MKLGGVVLLIGMVIVVAVAGYYLFDTVNLSPAIASVQNDIKQTTVDTEVAKKKVIGSIEAGSCDRYLLPLECRCICRVPMLTGSPMTCEYSVPGWSVFDPCRSVNFGSCSCDAPTLF
jgi:hypothetical protein